MMVPLLRVEDENELRKAERCLITKMKPNLNRRVTGNREKGKLRKQPPKKGRVNNKGETKDEGKKKKETFWTWVYDGKETMDFGGVIEKTKTPIIWQRGTIDMTEWDTLEEKYQIEASIDQDFGDLNFLKKKMRKNEIGMFRIMSCIRKDKEKEKRIRKMIKEGLDKVKDDELIWIWRKRELFKRSERAKITRKVNEEMEKRRGMPIPKNMILKIPPTEEVGKREIKKDIDRWLSKIGIGKQWKKWLQEETKVTEVRNKTVGDLLLNYREWARTDWFKIYVCKCKGKENGRGDNDHEIWRLEDIEEGFRMVTTKTVVTPSGRQEHSIIEREKRKWKWKITKLLGNDIEGNVISKRVKWKRSDMEEMVKKIKLK